MGNKTNIEWCDHTFNAWIGCTKVAAGCQHCYAEAMAKRTKQAEWGPMGTRVKTSDDYWKQPLRWNKKAERAHHAWRLMLEGGHDEAYLIANGFARPRRPRVFCASLADVFEDWTGQPSMSNGEWVVKHRHMGQFTGFGGCRLRGGNDAATIGDLRAELFRLIDATPYLDWLLLTKRPENIWRMWPLTANTNEPVGIRSLSQRRNNVWLGTSISTQADADRNIPELLKCRELSPVLFVSAEPLIEEIKLPVWIDDGDDLDDEERRDTGPWPKAGIGDDGAGIDWLIVGGESGPKARPCDVAWIRLLRDHCRAAGVPCFVKQLGASPIGEVGSAAFATDRKGGDPSEWPEDLRVREFPRVKRGE